MNWKKVLTVGSPIVIAVVITALITKSCSGTSNSEAESYDAILKEIVDAKNLVHSVGERNRELRDSVAFYKDQAGLWRDSTDFYKEGLHDCEESKKSRKIVNPVNPSPKPVVKPKPVPRKDIENAPETNINISKDSENNRNIVVNNKEQGAAKTEISLSEGSVNSGNILVNNGGVMNIYDDQNSIDSLRNAVDSLIQQNKKPSASASSVVTVKVRKRYYRTR